MNQRAGKKSKRSCHDGLRRVIRLPRFNLLTALVAVGLLAIMMSVLTMQHRIASRLRGHGVHLTYRYQYDHWADPMNYQFNDQAELSALESWFGADLCSRIVSVSSNHGDHPAEIAELACKLPHLRRLAIKRTSLVDRDIRDLPNLRKLRKLELHGTEITDASVAILSQMTDLQHLGLIDTKLSDEAIRTLRRTLPRTRITTKFGGHM